MSLIHSIQYQKFIEKKIIGLKLWLRIQRYAAVDFQGWSKMTVKIKMAYFSIFRSEFREILSQSFAELHRQA